MRIFDARYQIQACAGAMAVIDGGVQPVGTQRVHARAQNQDAPYLAALSEYHGPCWTAVSGNVRFEQTRSGG